MRARSRTDDGHRPLRFGLRDRREPREPLRRETARRLIEAGRRAVEEDHAEALLLGCTMEIGFYKIIEAELDVPVIDPAIAAFKRAEYGAELRRQFGWTPSRKWSCEPPSEAEIARFGVFEDVGVEIFANRMVIEA
jgi:allantoin racemase